MLDKTNIAGIASLVVIGLTGVGELIRFVGPLFGFQMSADVATAVDQLATFTFGLAVGTAATAGPVMRAAIARLAVQTKNPQA